MGRGTQTIRDHFSGIFGNRRGAGRPSDDPEVLNFSIKYTVDELRLGYLLQLPREVTSQEWNQVYQAIHNRVKDKHGDPEYFFDFRQPSTSKDLVFISRKEEMSVPEICEVAQMFQDELTLRAGQIRVFRPLTWVESHERVLAQPLVSV